MRVSFPVAVLAGAAAMGVMVGVAPIMFSEESDASYSDTVAGCSVADGDTIRCGDERVRLLAIDAPELPGHCKGSRVCAPGDPYASTDSLRQAMTGDLTIDRVGEDRYGTYPRAGIGYAR
jgi:micrococcal nuclease